MLRQISPGDEMRGDLEWGTIPGLLDSAAERFGARDAVVDGDTRITFEHLRAAARHAAGAAIATGVEPGNRVAIWAPNIHEWIVAALGALYAGGVLVPINTRFKGREAGFVLQKSRAKLLFTVRGFLDIDYPQLLRDAGAAAPSIVLLRGEGETEWDTFAKRGEEVDEALVDKRAAGITSDALSDIIFTSGTTGQPKGVMTTHAQSLRVFEVWSDIVGLREGDRYLIVNPFFHTFGYKAGILACLMRGATIVPHAVFDAGQVMRRIGEEKITVLPGPPTLYQSILNDPARASLDLSSLRLAVTG
ncbi:MAG TPA: AMP-binding protein, partial [Actinomycetota bacterium]|nr:AMP-binding protein [Actinomycetota bacterium]